MALFTDGALTSIEELKGHDTQLLNVATTEGIDVTRKLALAQEELSVEVSGLLARMSGAPGMGQVVVTPPLRLWHIFRTLEMVYRDAYNSQLNDRYGGKRDEYHVMAQWAWDHVTRGGLGIVGDPVEKAAMPEVTPASGGLADGTYYVAVAWTNAAGEEGCGSSPPVIQLSGGSFEVRTTAPPYVQGWNVYCGTGPEAMTIQNGTVLSTRETWVAPATISTNGRQAGLGQVPTYRLPVPRTIQRG